MNTDYSVTKISQKLIKDLKNSLASIKGWGSMEVYVQDGQVTQITVRNIKKVAAVSENKKSK